MLEESSSTEITSPAKVVPYFPTVEGRIRSPKFRSREETLANRTAFLRQAKKAEVAMKEELGVDEEPLPFMSNIVKYPDHPVMSMLELEGHMRQECVQQDECNGDLYWTELGMHSTEFLNEIPRLNRTHVAGLVLGYPESKKPKNY
jgi:hypothetical protein